MKNECKKHKKDNKALNKREKQTIRCYNKGEIREEKMRRGENQTDDKRRMEETNKPKKQYKALN